MILRGIAQILTALLEGKELRTNREAAGVMRCDMQERSIGLKASGVSRVVPGKRLKK